MWDCTLGKWMESVPSHDLAYYFTQSFCLQMDYWLRYRPLVRDYNRLTGGQVLSQQGVDNRNLSWLGLLTPFGIFLKTLLITTSNWWQHKLQQSLCCDLPFIPPATGIWAVKLQHLAENKEMQKTKMFQLYHIAVVHRRRRERRFSWICLFTHRERCRLGSWKRLTKNGNEAKTESPLCARDDPGLA